MTRPADLTAPFPPPLPCIVVDRHRDLVRVYPLASAGYEPSGIIATHDQEEARDCARIMADCTGWPIIDKVGIMRRG